MTLDGKFERGKIKHFHVWASREVLGNTKTITEFLEQLVKDIGMTPHGKVQVHKYPTKELGFTATACVAIQHLHESYVVFDNWIEYDPAYANIVINSCKSFNTAAALSTINRMLKPVSIRVSSSDYYTPQEHLGRSV